VHSFAKLLLKVSLVTLFTYLPGESLILHAVQEEPRSQSAPTEHGHGVLLPPDYLFGFADYTFHLDDEQVKCLAVFSLTVLPSDKFVRVPLLKDEISAEAVRVNGKLQDLTPVGGWLSLLPKAPCLYTIEIEFSLKTQLLQGIRSISFGTPGSAVNRARLKSERRWLTGSKRLPYRIEVCEVEKAVAIFPGEEFELQWEEVPLKGKRPPLFSVAPDIFYLMEGQGLYISARLATTIYAGTASGVNLVLPPDATKIDIHGAGVKRFERQGTETIVDFKGEIEGRTDIFVALFCPVAEGRNFLALPILSIQNARISGGTIAISCPSDLDLLTENISQVEEIALYEIPISLKALARDKPVRAFRIRGDSPRLSVKTVSLEPLALVEAVADRADFTSFRSLTGGETVKVSMSVRNDRRQFLRVYLPEGTQMGRCLVSGREVTPGKEEIEGEILIPLEKSIETLEGVVSFPVEFVYFTKNPVFVNKGSAHLTLPSIDIPIAWATWTAYVPGDIKVVKVTGNMPLVKNFEQASKMLEYGRGYQKRLAENYWINAIDAYKRQDYEEAGRNLRTILEKYPESGFAKDARHLMGNVNLASQPQVQSKPSDETFASSDEKAVRRIQRQMESQQIGLEIEQQELIKKAEEAELKGETQKSVALMEKAKQKSEVMLKRGVPVREQKAIMRDVAERLESQKNLLQENVRLQQVKRELERKIKEREEGKGVAIRYEEVPGRGGKVAPVPEEMDTITVGDLELQPEMADTIVPVYRLKHGVRETPLGRAGQERSPGQYNVALRQDVENLQQRLSTSEVIEGKGVEKPDQENLRRYAEIAAREVSRSIESAMLLASLGKVEEAATQVETVTIYYKESLNGVSGWAEVAQKADRFVEDTRRMPREPGELKDKDGVTLVVREEDINGLRLADEPLSEGDRKRFIDVLSSNVGYRTGLLAPASSAASAPAKGEGKTPEGVVRFSGGHAKEAFELLGNVSGRGGKTVNLSIMSNNGISVSDITAVGASVAAFNNGYYTFLDRAQKDILGEVKPPDVSEPQPVRLSDFFVGNAVFMPNGERVYLSGSDENGNVFVLDNKEIKLNPNQFLVIMNQKGAAIVGAGRAVGWGEARPEEKSTEPGFRIFVPHVGEAHLFEKLLLQAGEKPQVLIEYEEKGDLL
jgi:hypothetical protein